MNSLSDEQAAALEYLLNTLELFGLNTDEFKKLKAFKERNHNEQLTLFEEPKDETLP
jgi:hypothetical protein